MTDRGHSSYYSGARPPAGVDPMRPHKPILGADTEHADYRDTEPRHVWVSTDDGTVPGLLVGWRKSRGFLWQGRVTHAAVRYDRWVTVETWVTANQITPADPAAAADGHHADAADDAPPAGNRPTRPDGR